MAAPFVIDATDATFPTLVLGNSERGLVLAYFWSPRAGPCVRFLPRLLRLAQEYGGRFLLVRVNVDAFAPLARARGVTSLPTVQFYRHGRVVHTVHGVEAQPVLRAAVERYLPPAPNAIVAEAVRLFRQGEAEAAYARLAQAALDRPDDPRLPLDLARLMVQNGELSRAHALLTNLPPPLADHPEIESLLVHLTLILAAEEAPAVETLNDQLALAPDDPWRRFQRAARHLLADAYTEALDDLIEIVGRDPHWRRGLARRALLAVLALPAVPVEVAQAYRHRLAALDGGR